MTLLPPVITSALSCVSGQCAVSPVSRACEYNKLCFLEPFWYLHLWYHLTNDNIKEHRTIHIGDLGKTHDSKGWQINPTKFQGPV